MCCKVRQEFAKLSFRNRLIGSIPISSANKFRLETESFQCYNYSLNKLTKQMKFTKVLVTIAIAASLAACGPDKVSFDTLESSRTQGKVNAEWNAQVYRGANPQYNNTAIVAQTDSTMKPDCPQGDGWASVVLVDKANPAAKLGLKCSTVSGSVGCMTGAEFEKKVYATDDGRCQPVDKVPFPLPKLSK